LRALSLRILGEENRETVMVEHLAQARETHLDALEVRLRDSGIRRVVESIIVLKILFDNAVQRVYNKENIGRRLNTA
jgi:hypothetical protein